MRIVFAGTPAAAIPSLDAAAASRHELVAVLTRPDAPRGRGQRLAPSPVAARAAELGLETLKFARPREEACLSRLRELAPDCCPVVAYGAMLPQSVLDVPPAGWVNLHFSLLPAWRGAAPVQHAILSGDEVTGATTFRLVLELDAGPVYASISEPVRPDDTAGALLDRLAQTGAGLLVRTLDGIDDGSLVPTPQPSTPTTAYAGKLAAEGGRLDWRRPAAELDRVIRAYAPSPGAWTTYAGERLKVSTAVAASAALPPGGLQVTRRAVFVGTGSTALELREVQAAGKKPMTAADWARGITFGTAPSLGG